jgi:hypothetical protein
LGDWEIVAYLAGKGVTTSKTTLMLAVKAGNLPVVEAVAKNLSYPPNNKSKEDRNERARGSPR